VSDLRHTYSIIAHDPATGEFGGAVQSHWFNVGMGVLWAEAGVGVVASQSFANPAYGADGLSLMREGQPAQSVLDQLIAADADRAYRQVAMIDALGNVANFTGESAIAEHCRLAGKHVSVQANLMWKPGVCQAMLDAWESTGGDLAGRLMAALDAAETAGGDIRGKQSAALVVVKGEKGIPAYRARRFDLRVDDASEPLPELRRLLSVARAYEHMEVGDGHLARGDSKAALEAYETAMRQAPGNHEMKFWTAVTLVSEGDFERAKPLFQQAFEAWPPWRELVPRLPASGLLPDEPGLIEEIRRLERGAD
jgi:uncharacterized Ntn-hydrolase superfamily protein